MYTGRTSLFEFCGRGESKMEYYHYVGGDAVAGDLSCTVTPLLILHIRDDPNSHSAQAKITIFSILKVEDIAADVFQN